jgi:hypothetical protein
MYATAASITSAAQTPDAPGALASFFRLSNSSLNRSLPDAAAPPLTPLPLRSTSLEMRSHDVPPAVVSSRPARKASASRRVSATFLSRLSL